VPRSVPPRLLGLFSAVLVSITIGTLTFLPDGGTAPDATTAAARAGAPVTYTFAGDSATQATNTWSWTKYVSTTRATSVGGVGRGGDTSATVAKRVTRQDADVLVVMVGIGDVRTGVGPSTVRKNISTIVGKVRARHVVVAAIPPCDVTDQAGNHVDRRAQGFVLNRSLQAYASSRGWGWVDPFSSVRRIDNGWVAGTGKGDGVHPSVATAKRYLGPRMTVAITQAVVGAKP
jgi:lysophospholipase L1-like esterase